MITAQPVLAPLSRMESDYSTAGSDADKPHTTFVEDKPRLEAVSEADEDHIGEAQYQSAKDGPPITPEQNRAILRRIDLCILPLFFITQTLQFVDKTALNYGKVYGMDIATGLVGDQFSLTASMFYIGYLVAQPIFSTLIGRYPAGKVLGCCTVLWGVAVLTTTANKNFAGVMTNRFFLGALESAVTPGLSLMTGFWYTRAEQPFRQTIWYTSVGAGGMIGAFLAAGIAKLSDNPVPRWQLIFYILGAITTAWGFVLLFLLADSPADAFWLKKDIRALAVVRVAGNGTGIKSRKFNKRHALQALLDPKTWLLFISTFAGALPNGVTSNFSGSIITGMGFTSFNAALLDSAGRAIQIVTLLIAGYIASRFANSRVLMVTCAWLLLIVVGSEGEQLAKTPNCSSIGFALGLVMISANIGGYTKKSITSSLAFLGYCLGNIVGPLTVLSSEAPVYTTATTAMVVSFTVKLLALLTLGIYMMWQNKVRDRKYGPANKERAAAAGMQDKSEQDNPDFRYVY
ncbi:MFS general substrate transporter [Dioszegia hungarica]|uniref:MFS general substrate transporter n=1 Tax=Dioszegia hungarica TaxID=4972 RepID=A0AA38H139_9TREE|nr:MFS general substrate transporter [Dioszegia hungarica]KAI9631776.1 MFS general substrate transporter [Dioszegia hungarica]